MLAYWSVTGLGSTKHPFFSRHAQRALTVSGLRNWQTLFNRNCSFHLQYGEGQRGQCIKGEGWRTWCLFHSSVMLENNIYVIRMCLKEESSSHTMPFWHDISVEWRLRENWNKMLNILHLSTFSSKDFTHFHPNTTKMKFENFSSGSSKFKSIKFASQSSWIPNKYVQNTKNLHL